MGDDKDLVEVVDDADDCGVERLVVVDGDIVEEHVNIDVDVGSNDHGADSEHEVQTARALS